MWARFYTGASAPMSVVEAGSVSDACRHRAKAICRRDRDSVVGARNGARPVMPVTGSMELGRLGHGNEQETVMSAQIINLAEYRKAKEAEEVRKIVNDYLAAHSRAMAWWLSGAS